MFLSRQTFYNTQYKKEYRARMQQAQNLTQTEALEARVVNLTLKEKSQKKAGNFSIGIKSIYCNI